MGDVTIALGRGSSLLRSATALTCLLVSGAARAQAAPARPPASPPPASPYPIPPPQGSSPAPAGYPPGAPQQPGYAPQGYPPPGYPPPGYPPPGYPPPYPYGAPGYAPYPYAAPPPPATEREKPVRKAPAARVGFQLGLRTGLSIPLGSATGAPGDDLRARYSVQVPFMLDLGAKIIPSLYIGAYLGFGIGAEGADNRVERLCDDRDSNSKNDIGCSAYSVRIGVEARYYLNPADTIDPWLSYGIGFEAASQTIDDDPQRRSEETIARGIEFARLGVGFDWRAGRVFGLGPFAELTFGEFTSTRTEVNRVTKFDGAIEDKAIHSWGTLGLRGVFFP